MSVFGSLLILHFLNVNSILFGCTVSHEIFLFSISLQVTFFKKIYTINQLALSLKMKLYSRKDLIPFLQ